MATIGQDLRHALRRMKATPGFTTAAIATLALGLGVNSAVLSLAESLFLKPLPLSGASRLVLVDQTILSRPSTFAFPVSYPDYLFFRDHARTFAELAAHYATSPMHVRTPDGGLSIGGSVVTANYFSVLQLQPALGRFFTEPVRRRCSDSGQHDPHQRNGVHGSRDRSRRVQRHFPGSHAGPGVDSDLDVSRGVSVL
jgi:MacB-like periplasmic core domain